MLGLKLITWFVTKTTKKFAWRFKGVSKG